MRTWVNLALFFCLGFVRAEVQGAEGQEEFSFEYRDGMIWLEVHAEKSAEPLNFLLDSGAGVSALNLRTAHRLGLRLARPVEVQGVGSSTQGYFPQRLSASVGGIAMPRQYVAVDLDQLSGACHCQVDGLLGADFFRDRMVQIDFDSLKVRLLKPGTPLAGNEILPLRKHRSAFLVPAAIDGKSRQWMRVDTGCASALQWVTATGSAGNGSHRVAIALKEVTLDTVAANIWLGKTEFRGVQAELHPRPIFAGEDGLLGNGILSRFQSVTIDTIHGKVAFQAR